MSASLASTLARSRREAAILHTFGRLALRRPTGSEARLTTLRAELGWLGTVIGAVRDTDVLASMLSAAPTLPHCHLRSVLDDAAWERSSHNPVGYVSAGSPRSHKAVRSRGSRACVWSAWITASNCCAIRASK